MALQTKYSLNSITSYLERFRVIQEQNLASGFNFTEARAKEFDYFKKYQHAVNHGIIYGFGWRPSKTSFFRRSSLVFCEKYGYRL